MIFFDNHEASPTPWTKEVWYYDYRTNFTHTLKKKPMRSENLKDFISFYNPRNRYQRQSTWDEEEVPEGRWRNCSYEEIRSRDKISLDIFWLKDKSLTDWSPDLYSGVLLLVLYQQWFLHLPVHGFTLMGFCHGSTQGLQAADDTGLHCLHAALRIPVQCSL